MQQKAKSNSVVTSAKLDGSKIAFNVLGVGAFVFDKSMASQANRERAEDHGWTQRISDKAAIGRADENGAVIPKEIAARMKFDAMKACAEHYMTGSDEWSMVATGEPLPTNLTVRAIAKCLSISQDRALELVTAQAKKQGKTTQKLLSEYRTEPGQVRDQYIAMRDAELPTSGSSDSLLDELMNGGAVEAPVAPKFQKSTKPSVK